MESYKLLSDIKVLHLTLKKIHFDRIASGVKKVEHRVIKDYWISRLVKKGSDTNKLKLEPYNIDSYEIEFKEYDVVIFKNGYRKDAPLMVVECNGIRIYHTLHYNWCFGIELGKILYNSEK